MTDTYDKQKIGVRISDGMKMNGKFYGKSSIYRNIFGHDKVARAAYSQRMTVIAREEDRKCLVRSESTKRIINKFTGISDKYDFSIQ